MTIYVIKEENGQVILENQTRESPNWFSLGARKFEFGDLLASVEEGKIHIKKGSEFIITQRKGSRSKTQWTKFFQALYQELLMR